MKTFSVNRLAARRFLLDTQSLFSWNEASRPADSEVTLQMVRTLECVQLDPVSVVERNQHLVLAARIPEYKPEYLDQLLSQGKIFEYIANEACAIPIEDYPILEPIRNRLREKLQVPLEQLGPVAKAVLKRLETEGPLPSRAFQSENRVHGYWDSKIAKTKETSHALNLLLDAGVIRVVHREGTERFFDVIERTVPGEILNKAQSIELSAAREALIAKYIRAYRLIDPRDPRFGWQKMTASERRSEIDRRVKNETMVPLQIEDVQHQYFILAEDVEKLQEIAHLTHRERTSMEGPVRFLPPLDNLLWRRERVADLFDFHYKWEIYTPRSKRRYGPYAMPILYGDRLIGRMDPRLDRKEGRLVIRLLQLDPGVELTPRLRNNLREALAFFAEFHQARDITVEQAEPSEFNNKIVP